LAAAAVIIAWLGHGWLLRGLAAPLVSRQSPDGVAVLALWGDERGAEGRHAFDAAAAFYRQDPSRHILLIGLRGGRLVELGILSPFAILGRRELAARGVPQSAVEVVSATAADQWDQAQLLTQWLRAHPAATAAVYCNPLGSRQVRCILDRVAAPADAARVRVVLPADPDYDAASWWESRAGVRNFMLAWLEMAFTWCRSRPGPVPPPQNVAAYEETLRKAFEPSRK
jgi:hypothetical protein